MTVITVRLFEYEELKARLNPEDGIAVFSCDNCARRCDGLGGEQGLSRLANKLEADGFSVVCRQLFPALCSRKQVQARLNDEGVKKELARVDLILPLACQMGIDRVKELLPGVTVFTITKTPGKGKFSPETGARLTRPSPGVDIVVDDAAGIPLREAASRLGLFAGSF